METPGSHDSLNFFGRKKAKRVHTKGQGEKNIRSGKDWQNCTELTAPELNWLHQTPRHYAKHCHFHYITHTFTLLLPYQNYFAGVVNSKRKENNSQTGSSKQESNQRLQQQSSELHCSLIPISISNNGSGTSRQIAAICLFSLLFLSCFHLQPTTTSSTFASILN